MNIKNKKFPYILFTIFILLEVCVFILNKVTALDAMGSGFGYYINIIKSPWLWITFIIAIMQLVFWRKLLSKAELSVIYSLSSLSYPITMILSNYMFKENLHLFIWIGGGLISLGVLLVGSSTSK
ncbi:MAG: hypothetical protein WC197_04335 [Candidatus Gastranaerophilaceae bacterium]|jgi:uncharacterized membrane protein